MKKQGKVWWGVWLNFSEEFSTNDDGTLRLFATKLLALEDIRANHPKKLSAEKLLELCKPVRVRLVMES